MKRWRMRLLWWRGKVLPPQQPLLWLRAGAVEAEKCSRWRNGTASRCGVGTSSAIRALSVGSKLWTPASDVRPRTSTTTAWLSGATAITPSTTAAWACGWNRTTVVLYANKSGWFKESGNSLCMPLSYVTLLYTALCGRTSVSVLLKRALFLVALFYSLKC